MQRLSACKIAAAVGATCLGFSVEVNDAWAGKPRSSSTLVQSTETTSSPTYYDPFTYETVPTESTTDSGSTGDPFSYEDPGTGEIESHDTPPGPPTNRPPPKPKPPPPRSGKKPKKPHPN